MRWPRIQVALLMVAVACDEKAPVAPAPPAPRLLRETPAAVVTVRALRRLDGPVCAAVVAGERFLPGVPVTWTMRDASGTTIDSVDTFTTAVGRSCWRPIIQMLAGNHVATVSSPSVEGTVSTTIRLAPTRLEVNPASAWVGDTVIPTLSLTDESGIILSSLEPATVSVSGLAATSSGYAVLQAGTSTFRLGTDPNGQPLVASFVGLPVVRVRAVSMDSSSVAGSVVFIASRAGVDSAIVGEAGIAEVRLRALLPSGGPVEVLVVSADTASRVHLPSLASRSSLPTSAPLSALLVPAEWEFRRGALAGNRVPMSFAVGNSFTSIPSHLHLTWGVGIPSLHGWRTSDYPMRVVFYHGPEWGTVTAQDSIDLWAYLREFEAAVGEAYFEPAEAEDVIDPTIPPSPPALDIFVRSRRAIVVRKREGETSAGTRYESCVGACTPQLSVFLNANMSVASFAESNHSNVVWALMHALGHGNTCLFDSAVLGGGVGFAPELCAQRPLGGPTPRVAGLSWYDAAFLQARRSLIAWMESGQLGVEPMLYMETLNAELRRVYGIPPQSAFIRSRLEAAPASALLRSR